jgi:hypothetical protein
MGPGMLARAKALRPACSVLREGLVSLSGGDLVQFVERDHKERPNRRSGFVDERGRKAEPGSATDIPSRQRRTSSAGRKPLELRRTG